MKTKLRSETGLPLKKGIMQVLTVAALTAARDAELINTPLNEVLNVMNELDELPYQSVANGCDEYLFSVVNLSELQPLVQDIFTTIKLIVLKRGGAVTQWGLQRGFNKGKI